MRVRLWRPVHPRFMVKTIIGLTVLGYEDGGGRALVVTFEARGESVAATYAYTDDFDRPLEIFVKGKQRVGVLVRGLLKNQKVKIVAVPPVRWAVTGGLLRRRRPTEILIAGPVKLQGGDLLDYALAKGRGEIPEVRDASARRADALADVEEIREEFGMLTADIIYRIDYPALFDTAVATTEQFHVALIRFDDAAATATVAELEELAADVEVSYALARDHAERIAQLHLPEPARDDARRAAKAARLAENASTEGERVASMTQVSRILESLALYYLPTVNAETLAIDAPARTR